MNSVFEKLLDGEVVDGVKLASFNSDDYVTYALDTLDETEVVGGVEYTPHYAFINIGNDECAYIGIAYIDYSGENDIMFRVIGGKYEVYHDGGWCSFDTMFDVVSNG